MRWRAGLLEWGSFFQMGGEAETRIWIYSIQLTVFTLTPRPGSDPLSIGLPLKYSTLEVQNSGAEGLEQCHMCSKKQYYRACPALLPAHPGGPPALPGHNHEDGDRA